MIIKKQHSPPAILHLLQAEHVPTLPCPKVVGRPDTVSYSGEDYDQTGWMHRLIWVVAWRVGHFVVFSCSGSYINDTVKYTRFFSFFLFFFFFLFFDTLLYAFNYLGPFGKISSEQNLQKMVFSIGVFTFCTHHTVYGVFIRLCLAKWNWNKHFPSSKMQSYTKKIRKFYGRVSCINVHNALHQLHLRLTYNLRCIYVMCNANIPISSTSGIIRLMFSAHLLIKYRTSMCSQHSFASFGQSYLYRRGVKFSYVRAM